MNATSWILISYIHMHWSQCGALAMVWAIIVTVIHLLSNFLSDLNPCTWTQFTPLFPLLSSPLSAGLTFVSVHDCFWTHALTVDTMNKVSNYSKTFFFYCHLSRLFPHSASLSSFQSCFHPVWSCIIRVCISPFFWLINLSLNWHMWFNSSCSLSPLYPAFVFTLFLLNGTKEWFLCLW